MTTEQVIGCAPFRLQNPRPLTPYEWTVVGGAVLEGFAKAGRFVAPDTHAAVAALVGAIGTQNACPAWKSSAFAPAPAVASLPYECLGEWFARLDYQTRLRALSNVQQGLLCAPNQPWSACGTDPRRVAQAWEGAPQLGSLLPGVPVETCAEPRSRTAYIPTTVEELRKMFVTLGGQVPAVIEQGYQMLPPAARQRSLLLGVQLKPATAALPDILAGATNPMVLAQGLIEEVAIVWAPGKGSSLTGMLSGNVDPRALLELATAMMPDLLGGLLSGAQIPAIPGLPDLSTILGTLGGLFGQQKLVAGFHGLGGGAAPTSGATGVPVVDTPGSKLDTSVPIPGLKVATTTSFSPITAFAIAAGVGVGIWAIWKIA